MRIPAARFSDDSLTMMISDLCAQHPKLTGILEMTYMPMNNTLLGRCTAALSDAYELAGPCDDWTEMCAGAVLEHLAAELVIMDQQGLRLSVHELARILTTEGRSCQPEPIET